MGKLMKYELFRRSKLLITLAILLVFLEGVSIYSLYRGDNWLVLFFAILGLMMFSAIIFPLIDAIANYYSDFKNTHGYMLFLTPNNGYQIIGSKALFALAELVVSVGVVAGFFTANFFLAEAFGYTDAIEEMRRMIAQIPQFFGTSTGKIAALGAIAAILQYFNIIMMAITAVTLVKTLLSQKSFNWLIALLFYIALATATQTVNGMVFGLFGFIGDIRAAATQTELIFNATKYILVAMGLYIVWIGAGYTVSSLLLNKRVDL